MPASSASENSRAFGANATAVAFPLGGIGTGNVSLGARGDLRDWEIFNHPDKGNTLPFTFFAIRTQIQGEQPVARVIEGSLQPPYLLSHGYHSSTTAGLPRLSQSSFCGEYPIAAVEFVDPDLPVQIHLEAYTPLIPLNPTDSGIPCAILTYTVTNITDTPVNITLVGSITNPVGNARFDALMRLVEDKAGKSHIQYRVDGNIRGLYLYTEEIDSGSRHYGNMSLVTDHPAVSVKPVWMRGAWEKRTFFDMLQDFWDDFLTDGLLDNLGYEEPSDKPDTGSLGVIGKLAPGESQSYRFILTWFFPNRPNSWDQRSEKLIRNHYATRFDSAWAAAHYVFDNLPRLENGTRQFHNALFDSTLPHYILDAVSANIVPVRSTTCFWLEDGRFFGWEGCHDNVGCCPGSCTHVWNYAQTVAFLFPSLEREMRRIEFTSETDNNGYMNFRAFSTFSEPFVWMLGRKPEAAVDGQLGSIVRAYREWLLSTDKEWLTTIWSGIKRSIDFAGIHWDTDGDGVLDSKQHNTYDIEFYGPNPLGGIHYLAALRAVEELAQVMNEPDLADRCRRTFERGSQNLDKLLWNGEYYVQLINDVNSHKYQHGSGCLSDQLLGQLCARIAGLGDLLPADHVHKAIKAVYDYNFRADFHGFINCQRAYVFNDESGLVVCSWPQGGRPRFPVIYADEVWTGIEYQVASHLIYEGWVEQGLSIVKAVQARYDGIRRNPWNEVECGHHYARSMSSWALLLALSGMHFDLPQGELRFDPALEASTNPGVFQTIWSNGKTWGIYVQRFESESDEWVPEITVLGTDVGWNSYQTTRG